MLHNATLIRATLAALLVLGALVGSGICGRATEFQPDAQPRPGPSDPTPSEKPFQGRVSAAETPVTPRAILYEEDLSDPQGKRAVGSVIWRTEMMSPGIGKPPQLAVRADIEIPERKMSLIWKLRRDTDLGSSTSHTIDVIFTLPPDFPGGGIFKVPGVWMKQTQQTQGIALAGLSVKVTTGYFMIGLSNAPADKERNIQSIKDRSWIDIPIVYTNNGRAILAIEKGASGERAFMDAFAAWGDAVSEIRPSLPSPPPPKSEARSSAILPFPPPGTRPGATGGLPLNVATDSVPVKVPVAEGPQPAPAEGPVYGANDRENCADDAENPDQKIAGCSRVIADNTANAANRAHAYRSRGTAYYTKGDFDRAIADFSEAIKLNTNSAELYKDRGNAYRDKKDDVRAIADFDQAIKLDPNYALVYNNRGAAYSRRNDLDHAIGDYDEAIRLNPNYALAYDNRGFAYFRKNDLDHAISDYNEAIRLNSKLAGPYARRCNAYYSMSSYDLAIADCGEAIRLNPKDDFARSTLGFANAAAAKRDYEAVGPLLNRLSINLPMNVAGIGPVKKSLDELNREPCNQQSILDLGLALDKVGRKREAANAQLSFSAACGGYAPSLKAAADLLLALADYDGAATAASELIKLDAHNDSGFNLRAVAYDRGGSTKKAIDDYLTSIELSGRKVNASSDTYLAVARNYEKLGQFCDARSIIEAWVALNPSRNDSGQMQAIIADYTARGKCDAANSRNEEVFRSQNNVLKLPVVINGVRGTFIMDTGATFVTMKGAFAEKAKVEIDKDSNVKMSTANGMVDGKRGRAATIQLRSLQAKDVVVVVQNVGQGSYGEGIDGLLGLSFLSRFKISIDAQTVKIANRYAK